MRHIILGLTIFVAVGTAHAYTTRGAIGCGQYVDDFNERGWGRVVNTAWLVGALTGYNLAMDSSIGKGVDLKSMELHAYNFCKENPLKSTANAAEDLILNLK